MRVGHKWHLILSLLRYIMYKYYLVLDLRCAREGITSSLITHL